MKNKRYQHFAIILLLGIEPMTMQAQAAASTAANPYFYESLFTNILLVVAGMVILTALVALLHVVNVLVKVQQMRINQEQSIPPEPVQVATKPSTSYWQRFYQYWTNLVPVEREAEIDLQHDYDGIRELDNSLPPWWVAMFVITIIFSGVYMVYYHWGGSGPSSAEEYAMEVEEAQVTIQAYLAKQANNVNESNVTAINDEQALALGKTLYDANCVACHGAAGEGGVGPNLTDAYWLHGGGVQDIFKTIKYGVPEKGMIAWSAQLRPADMQRVASYILTLQGTNPPNGKAPQGTKYEAASDSTSTQQVQTIGMN